MRKNWIMAGFGILMVLIPAVCGACSPESAKDKEKRVFTYAENQPEDYPTTQGAYRFAQLVAERTDDRIIIQVNAAGVLGDERLVIEQMQFGGVDFARVSLSPLANYVPELDVLQMPYLYKDADHMWKVLEGPVGDRFLDSFGQSNLVALSWYDAGARNFYNSVKPIETLEDIRGMKIRVQESELMLKMIEAFGAEPSLMAYSEVYSGLQTGYVDGAENNWPSYEATNHYEVAKYITVDEHTRIPELQICARSTWESLSEEDQEIIRQCAAESAVYERELWAEREWIAEQNVRRSGTEVVVLTEAERERFRMAVLPLYEETHPEYMELMELIMQMGEE